MKRERKKHLNVIRKLNSRPFFSFSFLQHLPLFLYFAMMKPFLYFAACLMCLMLMACRGNKKEESAENDLDAARRFIRAALDGKFDEARRFMLNDSVNTQFLDAVERHYDKTDPDSKKSYREASINIHLVKPLNDSTTLVIYSNSFKNDHDTLRVLKTTGRWLVDLKYLWHHAGDSLLYPSSLPGETIR